MRTLRIVLFTVRPVLETLVWSIVGLALAISSAAAMFLAYVLWEVVHP